MQVRQTAVIVIGILEFPHLLEVSEQLILAQGSELLLGQLLLFVRPLLLPLSRRVYGNERAAGIAQKIFVYEAGQQGGVLLYPPFERFNLLPVGQSPVRREAEEPALHRPPHQAEREGGAARSPYLPVEKVKGHRRPVKVLV